MRSFIFILLLLPIGAGYWITKNSVDESVKRRLESSDVRYIPTPEVAKLTAFGFKEAVADFYWIEAINYFGEQLVKKNRNYKYLQPYFSLILHLDPYFIQFYDWASTVFIYNGLPVTKSNLENAVEYANLGIINLHSVARIDTSLVKKGGFNYSLEAGLSRESVPYFALAGRASPTERDMLLIASSYAIFAGDFEHANKLKEEFLAYKMYEAYSKDEIREALAILSSPTFNSQASEFVRALRLRAEEDEEIRELVENRLSANPLLQRAMLHRNQFEVNERVSRLLSVDISKNWMPPALHLLLDL